MKAELKDTFITLTAHTKKEEKFKIKSPSFHNKKLEREEQVQFKAEEN